MEFRRGCPRPTFCSVYGDEVGRDAGFQLDEVSTEYLGQLDEVSTEYLGTEHIEPCNSVRINLERSLENFGAAYGDFGAAYGDFGASEEYLGTEDGVHWGRGPRVFTRESNSTLVMTSKRNLKRWKRSTVGEKTRDTVLIKRDEHGVQWWCRT